MEDNRLGRSSVTCTPRYKTATKKALLDARRTNRQGFSVQKSEDEKRRSWNSLDRFERGRFTRKSDGGDRYPYRYLSFFWVLISLTLSDPTPGSGNILYPKSSILYAKQRLVIVMHPSICGIPFSRLVSLVLCLTFSSLLGLCLWLGNVEGNKLREDLPASPLCSEKCQ